MSSVPDRGELRQGTLLTFDYEFEGHRVRCGGTKDKPWFVAQDVCEVLGLANVSDALTGFDGDEKDSIAITDSIGRRREMLVVYEPGLYQLIFKSRKPEAKRFQRWVFHEVLPSIRKTGEYRLKQRRRYERLGKTEDWIEKREQGIEARNTFTGVLAQHSVHSFGYARCTDAINKPVLGATAKQKKIELNLPAKAPLRDHLPLGKILELGLAEFLAARKIERENAEGNTACEQLCAVAGYHVARAVKQVEDHGQS